MTTQDQTDVGVFHDSARAQEAIRALKQAGFVDTQIGVVAKDKNVATEAKGESKGSHVAEGAGVGIAAGAGVGALWALGIAAGFMPVIGPVVAGGLLASVLASAAGGAAIAGVAGALIGLGIPEEDAHYYEGELKEGRVIVTVQSRGRGDTAASILQRFGGYNRKSLAASPAVGDQTVQVHEERLHATKQNVEAGEVRVRKDVVTEQKVMQVPVTREEVVIERRPVSGKAVQGGSIESGEEIRIPVMEEKVRVEKEAVVTEEVSVGKRKVTGSEQVSGTVRKEKVHVKTEGDALVHDGTDNKKRG